ncbi:probable aspartyl protease At4g16563 [Humulus lupulus]|uniref:probable aspartyl protease At4g16563 n=1 Tax=Humulus lupulus TaxID=3486 RepID=UPI002B401D10|nr:probable aspartyl protease At4g16563 [Humulus lupulus]
MASSSATSFLSFITLVSLFLLPLSSSSSSENSITIPLSVYPQTPSSDPFETLNFLASASISRAHRLKQPKSNSTFVTKTPLFPRSYGAYSISLKFGSPPQTSSFIMDTGSSLVWLPCTSRYLCSRCAFPNVDPSKIPTFSPKLSSSAELIGCENRKCKWVQGPNVKCKDCDQKKGNCTQSCPAYIIQYGSGSTAGLLLSETLSFPEKAFTNILIGCSLLSIRQPSGIAGFGRGLESLPSQLGLTKFSHCLVSRQFDDTSVSSDLVLYRSGDHKTAGEISYSPFQKNPSTSNPAFKEYYYVLIRKIVVGGKRVKIPYEYLVPGSDGNGGTIVDSGSTFTYLEKPVYDAVTAEFAKQMSHYKRELKVENQTGLSPCFDISQEKSVNFPDLVFQFKGGAKMAFPVENYFALVSGSGIVCLTMVTNNVAGPEISAGPAIILGSFQQQNFYVEYDLKNDRFGFRPQSCK